MADDGDSGEWIGRWNYIKDTHYSTSLFCGYIKSRSRRRNASIVNENVNPAFLFYNFGHGSLYAVGLTKKESIAYTVEEINSIPS